MEKKSNIVTWPDGTRWKKTPNASWLVKVASVRETGNFKTGDYVKVSDGEHPSFVSCDIKEATAYPNEAEANRAICLGPGMAHGGVVFKPEGFTLFEKLSRGH